MCLLIPTASYLAYANVTTAFDGALLQAISASTPIFQEVDLGGWLWLSGRRAAAIEALDEGVLNGFARSDVVALHAYLVSPGQDAGLRVNRRQLVGLMQTGQRSFYLPRPCRTA